jgi:rfaE bifunctional protein nucleotidyltransferase chain/domain
MNNFDWGQFNEDRKDKKIVFTNGCYDIIHRGHITLLNQAKSLGDLLVLGLNSDESVKSLKGDQRPINSQLDRKFVLENLRSIDYVVIFDDLNPLNLILHLRPDVLVKGGDWTIENIIGAKEVLSWGGEVHSLPFVTGYSTTETISKINNL